MNSRKEHILKLESSFIQIQTTTEVIRKIQTNHNRTNGAAEEEKQQVIRNKQDKKKRRNGDQNELKHTNHTTKSTTKAKKPAETIQKQSQEIEKTRIYRKSNLKNDSFISPAVITVKKDSNQSK